MSVIFVGIDFGCVVTDLLGVDTGFVGVDVVRLDFTLDGLAGGCDDPLLVAVRSGGRSCSTRSLSPNKAFRRELGAAPDDVGLESSDRSSFDE
ncbi:MAG TPA: hypothetical protein VHV77_03095, partial [Pirellulales bacterium]|nr:hypothetical protein [Pirellulales bacterium]